MSNFHAKKSDMPLLRSAGSFHYRAGLLAGTSLLAVAIGLLAPLQQAWATSEKNTISLFNDTINANITNYTNTSTISGTLTSNGNISGATEAISNSGTIGMLINSGSIVGTKLGIYNYSSTIGTLINSGTIIGGPDGAIFNQNATINNLINSGTLSGKYGILNYSGIIGNISNSGLMKGTAAAIYSTGKIGTITNTGIISGYIYVNSQDLTIAGGSGSTYGTLSGSSININSGNLIFSGGNQFLAENITVNSGAGTVTNNGTLALAAKQTITGNYTQGSTGTLNISATSASSGGKLIVTGNANMANTNIVFTANGFKPTTGSTYVLVSAAGAGTSYAGDTITTNLTGYTPKLLTVASASDPALEVEFLAAAVSPTMYADGMMAQRDAFLTTSGAIAQQLQAGRSTTSHTAATAALGNDNHMWMSANGQYNSTSAYNGVAGYKAHNGGVIIGAEHSYSPHMLVGLAIDASQQNLSDNSSSYSGQTEQVQLYASAHNGRLVIDGQMGALFNQGSAKRTVSGSTTQALGNVEGSGFGLSVRMGMPMQYAGWKFEPGVTVGGMALAQNAVNETGTTASNLSIGHGYLNSLYAMPNLGIGRTFSLGEGYHLASEGLVGVRHEMMSTRATLNATLSDTTNSFASAPIGRDAAALGLNFELKMPSQVRVFARYATELSSRASNQTGQTGVKLNW